MEKPTTTEIKKGIIISRKIGNYFFLIFSVLAGLTFYSEIIVNPDSALLLAIRNYLTERSYNSYNKLVLAGIFYSFAVSLPLAWMVYFYLLEFFAVKKEIQPIFPRKTAGVRGGASLLLSFVITPTIFFLFINNSLIPILSVLITKKMAPTLLNKSIYLVDIRGGLVSITADLLAITSVQILSFSLQGYLKKDGGLLLA